MISPSRVAAATASRAAWARELLLVAAAAAAYAGVRAVTEGSFAEARANGEAILHLERRLGIAWEATLQALVLPHPALVTLANWVYIFGHWPVIVLSAIWLYRHRRPAYRRLRNAMFLSGAAGFLFFALLPAAPPRLLGSFVDTVADRSSAYRALQPPSVTNQIAAMPSLHFGWNLLVGIVVFTVATTVVVRLFAVAMPAAMCLSILATGNHFVLDAAVGGALVLATLALVVRVERAHAPAEERHGVRRRAPVRQRPRSAAVGRG